MAMLLHILGALLNPLQELLVSQVTIKVPLTKDLIGAVTDIYALTDPHYLASSDQGSTVAALRSTLTTARESDRYQNLWPENAACSSISPLRTHPLFNYQHTSTNVQGVEAVEDSQPT